MRKEQQIEQQTAFENDNLRKSSDGLKVGDILMFTGEMTHNSKNIIRQRYYEDTGLEPGKRCQIMALGKFHVNLYCPNGKHDFGINSISEDFVRCPREAAFEKLGI